MFSFLKWLSVIRAPGPGWRGFAFLWRERGSHVNPEEERIGEMQTNFVQSLALIEHWFQIRQSLYRWHEGWGEGITDQGVWGPGSIITALLAAGTNAGHLSRPLLMSVMRRGEAQPPRPSSGLTPGWSETDLRETRIPEIHSENEWDTENLGPGYEG